MKIKVLFSLMAMMVAALLAYLTYYLVDDTDYDWVFGVCAFLCFSTTLVAAMGLRYPTGALAVNGRTLSFAACFLFLLTQFVPAYINMNVLFYVVLNLVLLFAFLGILSSMLSTKQY